MSTKVEISGVKVSFLIEIPDKGAVINIGDIFIEKPDISLHLIGNDYEFVAWGDPISGDMFSNELSVRRSAGFIVSNLSGHYYFLFYDKRSLELIVGNSLFSILPVYYCIKEDSIIISDNVFALGKHAGFKTVSYRFILESLLFNYPLFNQSLIEGVMLLSSNSNFAFGKSGHQIARHTAVEEWFSDDPEPWRRSAGHMTDIFLETVKKYLPGNHYMTALTGGFDGRTLTAAGLYHDHKFTCYCFGSESARDLQLASEISAGAGIPFLSVNLDAEYLMDHSLEAGKEFIINSSGTATFTRAHYIHASSLLAKETQYIITGNFGSELFRAMHVRGVMISTALYDVFAARGADDAFEKLLQSPLLSFLNLEAFQSELAGLKDDLADLPCFSERYKKLTRNKQFYIFVLEEIFRKYFGSEMISQYPYVTNRTPFLDQLFIKELFSTGFAGIHSEFFEENPLKRYKGQMLYASVIREAAPQLGRFPTDKGYRPDDLLSIAGKLRVISRYLAKQMRKGNRLNDPLGVIEAWSINHGFYEGLSFNRNIFDESAIFSSQASTFNDEKARLFSLIYAGDYLNKI